MIRFLLTILVCIIGIQPVAAQSSTGDPMVQFQEFDRAPSTERAKAFFTELHKVGYSDAPNPSITEPLDTLKKHAWYWGAKWLFDLQDFVQSVTYAAKALPLAQAGKDRLMEADCEALLAVAYIRQGKSAIALQHASRVVELDKAGGNPDYISSSLNTLAALYLCAGNPKQAYTHIKEALSYTEKANNPERKSIILGTASEICHRLGQDEEALSHATAALEIERTRGNKEWQAVRLSQQSTPLIALGRSQEAEKALNEAILVLRQYKNPHSLGVACNQMGSLLFSQGKKAEAAGYYQEALDIFVQQHDLYNESYSRHGLYLALRDTDPKTANIHNDRYNQLRDSLHDEQTGMLLCQYAAQHGYDQLQEEHDNLRYTRWLWVGIIIALIGIIAPVVFYFIRRKIQHERNKKAELEQHVSLLKKHNTALRTEADTASAVLATPVKIDDDFANEFLREFAKAVSAGIEEGKNDVESIAKRLGINKVTLRSRLQIIVGETPKSYINSVLMHRATYLLTHQPSLSVTEVAHQCGFPEPANFIRVFKRIYGVPPTKYLTKLEKDGISKALQKSPDQMTGPELKEIAK